MIDLDRLREARDGEYWDVEVLYALGDAALDAPTVWWCAIDRMGFDDDSTCDVSHPEADCGWVALVPVKGGQDAS